MKKKDFKREIASLLAATMVVTGSGFTPTPVYAETRDSKTTTETDQSLLGQIKQGKFKEQKSDISMLDGAHDASDEVTIIVELKQAPLLNSRSAKSMRSLTSLTSVTDSMETSHNQVKLEISQLFASKANQKRAFSVEKPQVTFGYDYYVVLNGFSVKTQYKNLEKIRKLDSVKDAYVANSYLAEKPEETIEKNMANSSKMVGASIANESGYTGKKTVVAVLDSGLDVDHDAFNSAMPTDPKYQKSDVENRINQQTLSAAKPYIDKVYINEKVPYVYDYADEDTDVDPGSGQSSGEHGTHVSGTIAANTEKLRGVAPDAQLMMMKVFSSSDGTTSDDILLAALDDSVKLGADVINMSLGSSAGFSSYTDEAEQRVYERIREAGINLAISAGNSNQAADGNQSGQSLPFAEDPDYAIVGSPSTYPAAMSVASMISSHITNAPYLLAGDRKIYFNDASQPSDPKIYNLNGTYPYVYCGLGSTEDFEKAGNVKGKIALVKRGQLSFSEKTANAAAAGAKAIVVMNNQSGSINMQVDPYTIPAVSITQEDGMYLREQKTKKIAVSPEFFGTEENPLGYQMSEFSSWGCAPDLKLKPEITAPGENIYSSVLDNSYALMSGTSMASPHIAGLFADAKQYLNEQYPDLSTKEKYQVANAMLMSTATPAKNENGDLYSPRKQGAGLANIEDFVQSEAYLSVEGQELPKAELGANTDGSYSFSFTVHNISDREKTYTVDTSVLLEELTEDGLNSLTSKDAAKDGASVTYNGLNENGKVTVGAQKTAEVSVRIQLDEACKAKLKEKFVNGNYVEGFVRLLSEDTVDLTLPYLGFFGDWQDAPVLDKSILEDYHMFGNLVYNKTENAVDYLGQNILYKLTENQTAIDPTRYVISPNSLQGLCSELATHVGLLRNAATLSYTITDADGKVVKKFDYDHLMKSYLYQNQIVTWAEAFMYDPPSFDGTDADGKEVPEGMYTCTVLATADGTDGSKPDTWSFDFAYDKTPSEVKSYAVREEAGHTYLDLVVTDNHYLSGYQIVYDEDDVLPVVVTFDPDKNADGSDVVDENGNRVYTLQSDLTPLLEQLKEQEIEPDKVSIDLFDYAMNVTEQELTIKENQSADQSEEQPVKPSSDDYKIDENGVLTSYIGSDTELVIPEGVTEIAGDAIDYSKKAQITKVTLPKSLKKIQPYAFSNCTALETVVVPEESQLEEIGNGAFSYCALTTFAIPKTLKKLGTRAFYYCSYLNHITLPDDMTEIASYTFGRCQSLDDVHFPKDLKKVGEGAFNVTALSDAALPDGVEEIGAYAFRNCAFTSVKLPKSCKKIGRQSFAGCYSLKEFYAKEALTSIGDSAFAEDSALEKVELGANVTEIGAVPSSVFLGCEVLKTLKIDAKNTAFCVKDGALYDKKQTKLYVYLPGRVQSYFNVPNSVKAIDQQAFYHAIGLKDLVLNEELETIGAQAFDGCESIVSFKIPDRVTKIGEGILQNCTSLQNLVIGNGLRVITRDTCRQDNALKNIVIGNKVEKIEPNAFENVDELQYLTLPDSVKTLQYNAFLSCKKLKQVQIGAQMEDLDPSAFSFCNVLERFTVSNQNQHYADQNGVLYTKNFDELLKYPAGRQEESYTVAGEVKTLANRSFDEASFLKELVLPDGIKKISSYAFHDCSALSSIVLPDSLETIEECAFANTGLKRVRIPKNVKTIPWAAFMQNEKLNFVDLSAPESLTLDFSAFTGCSNLQTVIADANVTSVAAFAIPANENLTIYAPADCAIAQYANENQIKTVSYDGFTIISTADSSRIALQESYQSHLMVLGGTGDFKLSYEVRNAISGEVLEKKELPDTKNTEEGIAISYTPEVAGQYEIVVFASDAEQNKTETSLHFEVVAEKETYDWQYGTYDTTAALYDLNHDTLLSESSLFGAAKLEVSAEQMQASLADSGIEELQYYNGSEFADAAREEEHYILPISQESPCVIVKFHYLGTETIGRLIFDYKNAVYEEPQQEETPIADGQYSISGALYVSDWEELSAFHDYVDQMYLIRKEGQTTLLIRLKAKEDTYLESLTLDSGESATVIPGADGIPAYLQISLPKTVALTDATATSAGESHPVRIYLDYASLQETAEELPLV